MDVRTNEANELRDPLAALGEVGWLRRACMQCACGRFLTLRCKSVTGKQAQSLSPKTRLSPWNFFFFPLLPNETERPDTSPIGAVAVVALDIWLDCRI
jgi:hypothetical protein